MQTFTFTETTTDGETTIEREGVVWADGPIPHTVWVLPVEVIEAGFAPTTDEAMVVHTERRERLSETCHLHIAGRRLGGDSELFFRVDKYGRTGGIGRRQGLSRREWEAVAGTVEDQAADVEQLTIDAA